MLFLKKSCPVKMHNGKIDKKRKGGDPWPEGLGKHNALSFAVELDDDSKDCQNRIAKWEKRTGRKISDLEQQLPDTEGEEVETPAVESSDEPKDESKDEEQTKREIYDELKAFEKENDLNLEFNMNYSKTKLKALLDEVKSSLG